MAKLTQASSAQKLALRGKIDEASKELAALKSKGDVGAHASLAELAAYRGQWEEVLALVRYVFTNPGALQTMNVYSDLALLAARAGLEVRNWDVIKELAKLARSKLSKGDADEGNIETIRRLGDFAVRKGKGQFEPRNERRPQFEAALVKAATKKFATAAGRLDHIFGLARVFDYYDGAVALYDREKKLPELFDNAVFVASGLARKGRDKEAWHAIEVSVPGWLPVEVTQLAPVILLTDEALAPLMTAKRCEQILRTPRGLETI